MACTPPPPPPNKYHNVYLCIYVGLCTRYWTQGALLQPVARRHVYDIGHSVHHVARAIRYGSYCSCSCPTRTRYVDTMWDGEHYDDEIVFLCVLTKQEVRKKLCVTTMIGYTRHMFESRSLVWIYIFSLFIMRIYYAMIGIMHVMNGLILPRVSTHLTRKHSNTAPPMCHTLRAIMGLS